MQGPLDGLLVADFSRVLAGPLATMTLGDLGAEVVKVERPGVGDDTRSWGPPWSAGGESTYFQAVNRNKTSLYLDLSTVDGRAQARDLALRADILVHNFPRGTMERFGLGYPDLHLANRRLIYAVVSGFGPDSSRPGYDFLAQAEGGLMAITGSPDGPPTKAGVALVDVLAGQNLTSGILAALYARERTGRGQRVDVDLRSSLHAALVNQASAWLNAGVDPVRMGDAHPSIVPYQLLQASDRPIAVAVGNDAQFARLAEAVGLERDERFATNPGRVAGRVELIAALERVLRERTAAEWVERLGAAGVPCGLVNTVGESLAQVEVVELDGVRTPVSPLSLSDTPVSYRLAPPRLPTTRQ